MRALYLLCSCLEAHPPDGYFLCAATEPRCPSGYHCIPDHTCWADDPKGLTLLAGGLGGPGTADGPGKGARFDGPVQIASDGVGHLYITDERSRTVRRFDADTGEVSTVAGNPDDPNVMAIDGSFENARFVGPWGIAFANGRLYVTDGGNLRYLDLSARMVGSETVPVMFPRGLASDGTTLYIAEGGRMVVSSWTTGAPTTTVVAGTPMMPYPMGTFLMPMGLALHQGALYVTDPPLTVVIKVDLQNSNQVTRVAGMYMMGGSVDGANGRFSFLGGIASDGTDLYVADSGNQLLRSINAAGVISTVIGKATSVGDADGDPLAQARLNGPMGVAAYGGAVFVSEGGNHTLRRLKDKLVTTVAGAALHDGYAEETGDQARFRGPTGVAAGDDGNLYVADTGNFVIRRITASGEVKPFAGSVGMPGNLDNTGADARFLSPTALASDGKILYVADGGGFIRMVNLASRTVSPLAGGGSGVSPDGTGSGARFNQPLGLALALDGTALYVAESSNTIRQVSLPRGEVITLAGAQMAGDLINDTGDRARFDLPSGIAVAPDGKRQLYVADTNNHVIRLVDVDSRMVTTWAGVGKSAGTNEGQRLTARFTSPLSLLFDGEGTLLVADGNHTIRKIDTQGQVTTWAGVAAQSGVTLGPLPGRIHSPGEMALFAGGVAVTMQGENALLVIR